MSIVRGPRPETGWYALDKAISEDQRLSWAARGLLIFLLGKPDHWRVNVEHLTAQTAEARIRTGRDAVYALLGELEACGYMTRHQERGKGGKMMPVEYVVHEIPTAYVPAGTGSTVYGMAASGQPVPIVNTDSQQRLNEATLSGGSGGKKREKPADEPWWIEFRSIFPKRAGDPNVAGGKRCAGARLKEGHTIEEFLAGARRYAAFIRATGKDGTEYVQQLTRFLGPSKPFLLPWDPPQPPASREQVAQREMEAKNWAGWKHRASKVDFREPAEGETLQSYIAAVEQAERDYRNKPRTHGLVSAGAALGQVKQSIGTGQ